MKLPKPLVELEAETLGWLLPGEGEVLATWASRSKGPIIEIGSYCGKSTIWVGTGAREAGQLVVSIDPHYGNPEMAPGENCHHAAVWDEEEGTIDTASTLRRTLRRAELTETVCVICARSLDVASWWNTTVGMVFVDGDHGPAAIDDYQAWSPFLGENGILAFHDTAVPDVARACELARDDGWIERESVDGCLRVFTR